MTVDYYWQIAKLESWHWGVVIYNQTVTWAAFAILAMFNRKQVCVTNVLTCVGNGSWCALEGFFFKCPRNVSWRVLEIFLSALEMFPGVCWKSFWSESCVGLRLVAGRWLMDPQHKIVKEIWKKFWGKSWGNFQRNREEICSENVEILRSGSN